MDSIVKLKNMMVAACDAVQKGNRDIAINLLEIATDVMEDVKPEDIETQFIVKQAESTTDKDLFEETEMASTDEEDHVEDSTEVAHSKLHDILAGWDFKNGGASSAS